MTPTEFADLMRAYADLIEAEDIVPLSVDINSYGTHRAHIGNDEFLRLAAGQTVRVQPNGVHRDHTCRLPSGCHVLTLLRKPDQPNLVPEIENFKEFATV